MVVNEHIYVGNIVYWDGSQHNDTGFWANERTAKVVSVETADGTFTAEGSDRQFNAIGKHWKTANSPLVLAERYVYVIKAHEAATGRLAAANAEVVAATNEFNETHLKMIEAWRAVK